MWACAKSDTPVLRCRLGQTSEEIDAQSTFKILSVPGYSPQRSRPFLIVTPHRIEYADERLRLTLPDCGAQISMPTSIDMYKDRLQMIADASVLADYVTLEQAVETAEQRMNEVLAQGFVWATHAYARFAATSTAAPRGVNYPDSVGSIRELVDYFLNPDWVILEVMVFALVKGDLAVKCRIKNMRRSFPKGGGGAKAAAEAEKLLSREQRLTERSYYVTMSIVPVRLA